MNVPAFLAQVGSLLGNVYLPTQYLQPWQPTLCRFIQDSTQHLHNLVATRKSIPEMISPPQTLLCDF